MMYEAPAWQPWLSATRLEQLKRCQNRALRVMTGQLQTTPVETLRREAGVYSMRTLMRRQTAIAYEKASRLTPDHSRRRLLNSPVRHRLARPSWHFNRLIIFHSLQLPLFLISTNKGIHACMLSTLVRRVKIV